MKLWIMNCSTVNFHWKCAVHPLDTIAKDCDRAIQSNYEKEIPRPVDLFVPQNESVIL